MIKVTKHYGETIEINGKWKKLGVTLESDKELTTPEEVRKHYNGLYALAEDLISAKVEEIKNQK